MNKTVIFLISLLVVAALIEAKPSRRCHKRRGCESEESEEYTPRTCRNCKIKNIGNGYKNHNELYYD